MKSINAKRINFREAYQYLVGGVSPRPIALVSTISESGENNLAPFSFFNVFGANPPMVAFSATRRGRDGTFKDTYLNLMENKECVIQSVTYPMVEQMNLSSADFDKSIDEFDISGFTKIDSKVVEPKRVKESPFQMECILKEMISLGDGGASGNLAICEVVYFHISEDILFEGKIKPELIDLVGRNNGSYYTRANGDALFEVDRPLGVKIIGYSNLPKLVKESNVLSANNLAKLANYDSIPSEESSNKFVSSFKTLSFSEEAFWRYERSDNYSNMFRMVLSLISKNKVKAKYLLELVIKKAIEHDNIDFAWKVAVYNSII